MLVSLSDLKTNVGKYVDLVDTEEVIITKYGKPVVKIIPFENTPWFLKQIPENLVSIESLFGTHPSDINVEDIRMERLTR